ncbi:MAG: GntR family transcriptional regulator [Rhodospirillales bacterium]|nr:GntR family transcriptional regulator [Rhodospirillales bacterium]
MAVKPDLIMQTHDAIRAAIMSGELAPGAPLAQEELAESLGVSRQPISHALILLKREGLVVERGRKGQMVAPINADRLLALYQVRSALDRLAASLAAQSSIPSAERRACLDRLIEDGMAAVAVGNIERLVEADVAFHLALYEMSGNPEIAAAADNAWPHMVRAMRIVLEEAAPRPTIWSEHREIADAIVAGDAAKAGDVAALHAENAGETTCRRLKAQ